MVIDINVSQLDTIEQIQEFLDGPFAIRGFHSDSGSEYVNHKTAELLEKLRVEFTKSRPKLSRIDTIRVKQCSRGILHGNDFGAVVVECLGRSIADITKTLHDDPRVLHGESDTFRRFRRRHKHAASGGFTST